MKNTKKITVAAVLSALSVIFLFLAEIFPTGQLGIIAVASLFIVAAVIEVGIGASVFVFASSSIIGLIILPNKAVLLLYVLFFGYYPVLKSLVERIKDRRLGLLVKLIVFNAALSVVWLLLRSIIFGTLSYNTALIYIAGNAVFIAYDFGLSKLIGFYISRISRHIKK